MFAWFYWCAFVAVPVLAWLAWELWRAPTLPPDDERGWSDDERRRAS